MLIAALAFGGCSREEPWRAESPEFALNAFLQSLSFYDHETAWEFLSPETQSRIEQAVERQREFLPGDDDDSPIETVDLLYRVWIPSALHVDRLETLERTEEEALIAIHTIHGETQVVQLLRADGAWTIDLTTPPPEPPPPSEESL